jgi:hypothetical protein
MAMKEVDGAFTVTPNFGYTMCMLDSYDDLMSDKREETREAFGPRRERATSVERKSINFRMEPLLLRKLLGLTAIENGVAKAENQKAAHISLNAEIHYVLEEFIRGYEKQYGSIPDEEDAPGVTRHVKARTK